MTRKILVLVILLFMSLFLIQQVFRVIEIKKLNGNYVTYSRPVFHLDSLIQGSFQKHTASWVNQDFGFRNILVRLHNQIGFWLYKHSYTNAVVVGKDNYLLDKKYIDAYTGRDYIGEKRIRKYCETIKLLQDSLKAHHIQFLFVFAPGKASYFKEYIPDDYLSNVSVSNYESLVKRFNEYEINHVDFKKWFEDLKPISPYPLFPKCGIHWSTYGATIAADSLLGSISQLTKKAVRRIEIDSVAFSNDLSLVDWDVGRGMNLIWPIATPPMAYAKYHYSNAHKELSILTVADSYYWTMPGIEMADSVFKKANFVFYNKQLYVNNGGLPYSEEQINRARLVMGHDIVVVLSTDANLAELGWDFFDQTYFGLFGLHTRGGIKIPLDLAIVMNDIRYDQQKFLKIKEEAKRLNIPADSLIYVTALSMIKK